MGRKFRAGDGPTRSVVIPSKSSLIGLLSGAVHVTALGRTDRGEDLVGAETGARLHL